MGIHHWGPGWPSGRSRPKVRGLKTSQMETRLGWMAWYQIAWLPGDGIGKDVLPAARRVLDRLGLAAKYIHAEVGWDLRLVQGRAS